MFNLCEIAAIPSQSLQYLEGLRDHWKNRANAAVPEHQKIIEESKASMPWEAATALMKSAEQTKVRLEYGIRKNH